MHIRKIKISFSPDLPICKRKRHPHSPVCTVQYSRRAAARSATKNNMSIVSRPPFVPPVCYPCESALAHVVAICEGNMYKFMNTWDCSFMGRATLKLKEDCLRACAEDFCANNAWPDYCTEAKQGYLNCQVFSPCANKDFSVECNAQKTERCTSLLTMAPIFPASQVSLK
jgi:hypothetical protein